MGQNEPLRKKVEQDVRALFDRIRIVRTQRMTADLTERDPSTTIRQG